MSEPRGRHLPLSLPRRLVGDLVHQSRAMVCIERRMSLAGLVAAREACSPRPGWCAVFTKAFALVAARRPELRRAYMGFPVPHLYEHARNVATIAVERRFGGEEAVFFLHVRSPERLALGEIQARLRAAQELPVEDIGSFRRALRVSRLPRPVRRAAWWVGLNVSGKQRERHFGTFGVSVTAGLGAVGIYLLSPLTTTLYYGRFEDDGSLDVRLAFDHRVLDGGVVARALCELEEVLLADIVAELTPHCQRWAA